VNGHHSPGFDPLDQPLEVVRISVTRGVYHLKLDAGVGAPGTDDRLNTPPLVPTRCGTALFKDSAEAQMATVAAWVKAEEEYCDWVAAHPNPKPEWVATAERIRRR